MKAETILAFAMLVIGVGFNLWTYRFEPTAKIDPNDNPFQYALVDRTNQIWDYAKTTCGIQPLCFIGYLVDHWVPNWAQGYSLPYYYSHIPQILIVASYRLLSMFGVQQSGLNLFQYYHVVIYLLLCLFPVSLFFAFRILKAPPLIAGFSALIASHISTDGLYGLDPSSFLWRGYGLTSQLFAMIWMPLAIASAYRLLYDPSTIRFNSFKHFLLSVWSLPYFKRSTGFLTITISCHLGLGVITMLSLGILAISKPVLSFLHKQSLSIILEEARDQIIKLAVSAGISIGLLSYWIIPALLHDEYHNYSFWDPVWKFNSYGWREVAQFFFNGALFDFGRGFPILTVLLLIGGFCVFLQKENTQSDERNDPQYHTLYPFSFLFLFWMLMFFGRTTWGGLLDIIPSMKEFHQSRFIVGVHLAGFFLIPIGLWSLAIMLPRAIQTFINVVTHGLHGLHKSLTHPLPSWTMPATVCVLSLIVCIAAYPQTIRYASHNDFLIKRGNENFDKQNPDVDRLIKTLQSSQPGRTYTGRGGSWGKNLTIAETTYFMHLSTYGIPVILWLPETWSPSSDVEQFFIEEWKEHYNLMNIRYVVTPPDLNPQPFWTLKDQNSQWKLYTVETEGYFGTGSYAAVVSSSKFHYVNVVRLWLQSNYVKRQLFPQLTFNRHEMMKSPIPAFEMIDEATYRTRDGKIFGLFGDIPVYEAPPANLTVKELSSTADMEFRGQATVNGSCDRCIVFLKQTYHPNWRAWVNGKEVKPFIVFPFYTAISLETPGDHTIEFRYLPSRLKIILFTISLVSVLGCMGAVVVMKRKKEKRLD
ncbi:MAG: YfhO family protein [Patescibacteria group bacterium]|nr:YfhO family protein [Patescibacteria group bacterium]